MSVARALASGETRLLSCTVKRARDAVQDRASRLLHEIRKQQLNVPAAAAMTRIRMTSPCMGSRTVLSGAARPGISFSGPPQDQSWLWRETELFDPGGNRILLYHAGHNRIDPPWRIKPINT